MLKKHFIILFAALLIFTGCGGGHMLYKASSIEQDDEWIRMIGEYRKASRDNPDDSEARSNLKRAEFDASEYFYKTADELKNEGKLDEAIASLQKGQACMPENGKISLALNDCIAIRESDNAYKDAVSMKESGNIGEAQKLLEKALELQPMNQNAIKEYEKLVKEREKPADTLFTSEKKITLKYNNSDVKTVFDFIASTCGINVVYDEGVKTLPVSVAVKNVPLEQALNTVASSAGVFYKQVGPSAILVAQDNKAKHDQYDDLIIKTYQLNTIKAADMTNILKNALNLKRVTVNEALNSMSIRDTRDMLKLADKLVQINDVKPAEVVFDVEILEVNRTKAEQLGFNYGSQVGLTLPTNHPLSDIIDTGFWDMLKQGALTLPAFTLNFFKQDVDAKMLANPRVRVLQDKKAKIHIGERVPLQTSAITDPTGQVRYSYEYKDIGVMLDVTPRINMDNSVNVLLNLEVSSLGANLGTSTDPAYEIDTRDAETSMLLRDGETAILGGMIRDKESYSRLKVPGLGEIPLIGGLFTATNDTGDRTDLLLTITPRVVRRWETIDKDLSEIYSGTENNMSSEVKYYPSTIKSDVKDQGGKKSSRAKQAKGNISSTAGAAARQDGAGGTLNAVTISIAQQDAKAGVVNTAGSMGPQAIISFSEDQYILQNGQDSIIRIFAENIGGIEDMKVLVGFNQDYAGFIGAERSSPGIVSNLEVNSGQAANGVVELGLTMNTNINVPGKIELAALRFTGIKQGVSYLVFLANKIQNKEGIEVNIQRKTSRLLVQ